MSNNKSRNMYISIFNNVMTYEDNLCFVYDFNFHCVRSCRGLSGVKSAPFRHWYGNLGELRSLLEGVSFVVCTATATSTTKRNIFSMCYALTMIHLLFK